MLLLRWAGSEASPGATPIPTGLHAKDALPDSSVSDLSADQLEVQARNFTVSEPVVGRDRRSAKCTHAELGPCSAHPARSVPTCAPGYQLNETGRTSHGPAGPGNPTPRR